jgi:hypothetical protein
MKLNHIEKVDAMITVNTGRITRKAMPAQSVVFSRKSDVIEAWMLEGPRGGCYLLYFYKNGTFRCFNFNSLSSDLASGKRELITIDRVDAVEEPSEADSNDKTADDIKSTETAAKDSDTVAEEISEVAVKPTPNYSNEERKIIAQTIIEQLGGWGRLRAMTGASRVDVLESGARVKFPNNQRSRANCIVVNYDSGMDLYDVEFWRCSARQPWNDKMLNSVEGAYSDMLIELFEDNTGLTLVL